MGVNYIDYVISWKENEWHWERGWGWAYRSRGFWWRWWRGEAEEGSWWYWLHDLEMWQPSQSFEGEGLVVWDGTALDAQELNPDVFAHTD